MARKFLCTTCEGELKYGDKFCPHCGKSIHWKENIPKRTAKEKAPVKEDSGSDKVIGCIAIILVILVSGLIKQCATKQINGSNTPAEFDSSLAKIGAVGGKLDR